MDDIIHLNVGGIQYVTTKTTLCRPGSLFECMFRGQMKPGLLINGAYFIDRNGPMFAHILDYLRNLDQWVCPSDIDILRQLVNEAKFYCLQDMLKK